MSDGVRTLLQHLCMLLLRLQRAQLSTYVFIVAHKFNSSLSDFSEGLEFRFAETLVHLREPDEVFRHLDAATLQSRVVNSRADIAMGLCSGA
jgi:hypothetical protein